MLRSLTLLLLLLLAAAPLASPATGLAATGGAVTVWDTSGGAPKRCTAIDTSDPQGDFEGGCVVDMHGQGIDTTVRTVVGDMRFGSCTYEHNLRIDGSGRTLVEGMQPGGPRPCNDMGACYHEEVEPWEGQIEVDRDGRLIHVVAACFDTCMGQFEGEMTFHLRRSGGVWRQRASEEQAGSSGYVLDGSWEMEQRSIDIRPAGAAAPARMSGRAELPPHFVDPSRRIRSPLDFWRAV
jgi:hypothetical protein